MGFSQEIQMLAGSYIPSPTYEIGVSQLHGDKDLGFNRLCRVQLVAQPASGKVEANLKW